jgi:multicomponent Na+:H+ antiporter subunit G
VSFAWLHAAGDLLVAAGLFFVLAGVVGVLRLPDFYTRLQATGKCDTLGVGLMVLGLALQQPVLHHALKMLLLLLFVALANPTATHALGRAALRAGLEPWTRRGGGVP